MYDLFELERLKAALPDVRFVFFHNVDQWKVWCEYNTGIADNQRLADSNRNAIENGLDSLWFGHVPREQVYLQEGCIAGPAGIFERHRMLLNLIAATKSLRRSERIYAAEARSTWALAMRGRYAQFVGSEYCPELDKQREIFPIQHQDLTRLSYPDASFDVCVTSEVLEHVDDLQAALRQMARVLTPDGVMLSTFPFLWNSPQTVIKSRNLNGRIVHLGEPEHHQDPLRAEGALVFQVPGWDILDMAREAGFSDAAFLLFGSKTGGVKGRHIDACWCMVARKN